MKYMLSLLSLVILLSACEPKKTETSVSTPKLTLKWESDTLFTTCESVIYDPASDMLYVSNINGDPSGKDGNGFISKLSLDGKLITQQWITGMDAPKGMGMANGKLYVSDINRVHEIDLALGKIVYTYTIDSAQFLNDITTDAAGKVYVSDMMTNNILVLEDKKVSVWMEGATGVNGLLSEGDKMVMVSFMEKTLSTIDAGKLVSLRTDSLDFADGVEATGDGGYLVSGWNGTVYYVDGNWNETLLLDTRADSVNAADIEYIAEKKLLLVPTFFKNKVAAYELTK
jgi:hypothetical protein